MSPSRLACAVLCFALLTPPRARAASGADKEHAMALLRDGAERLRSKDYEEALDRFTRAYRLVPSAKIQFNVGLAYEGLARAAQAWAAFQSYLDGAVDDDAERRREAKAHQTLLEPRVAFLLVTGDVVGAMVSVDGAEAGHVPLERPLPLEPGAHQVLVTHGERSWTRAVRLEAGATVTLDAVLQAPPTPQAAPVTPPQLVVVNLPREEPSPPLYTKGWFWVGVGAVVVGAVIATVLLTSRTDYQCNAEVTMCFDAP